MFPNFNINNILLRFKYKKRNINEFSLSFYAEMNCTSTNCSENMFSCGSNECIEYVYFCDGSTGNFSTFPNLTFECKLIFQ